MQSRGDGVKRGRNNQFPPNIKTLSAQQAVIGTLLYLIKAAPTGVLRRNIFLDTEDGNILVPKYLEKPIEEFSELLKLNKDVDIELEDDFEEMSEDSI